MAPAMPSSRRVSGRVRFIDSALPPREQPRALIRGSQQRGDRPLAWQFGIRLDLMPRGQHESAFVGSRMRQRQSVVMVLETGERDDVEVERTIAPALCANPV